MTLIETIDAARLLVNEPLDSSRTFPDNTSTFWKDSELITYFNMVQNDVSVEIMQTFEDYFLTHSDLAITSGCANYTLPTRFVKARRLEDRRSSYPTEIYPVTINERVAGYPEITNDGMNNRVVGGYFLAGNNIMFHDTPTFTNASAIRLYYVRALADVTAATATSEIPPEHHRLLVWGIVKYCLFQQQSDTSKADVEYDKMMAKLKGQCENRQIQRPRAVKSNYYPKRY